MHNPKHTATPKKSTKADLSLELASWCFTTCSDRILCSSEVMLCTVIVYNAKVFSLFCVCQAAKCSISLVRDSSNSAVTLGTVSSLGLQEACDPGCRLLHVFRPGQQQFRDNNAVHCQFSGATRSLWSRLPTASCVQTGTAAVQR